jgi:dihydrolipoamide dehydrogenase
MVMGEFSQETEVLVIGGGPAGYAAAFRAADLGQEVTLVNKEERPGGVCLFRGCIPSKTLLHAAGLIQEARRAEQMGISFREPAIDLERLREFKNGAIDRLTGGLRQLTEKRGIEYLNARAVFEDSGTARLLDTESDISRLTFKHAVLAAGAKPVALAGTAFGESDRIMGYKEALDLPDIPERLLVVGGGYIGLELGSLYAALGSRITLVEMTDTLLPGADRDLFKKLMAELEERFAAIHTKTSVKSLEADGEKVSAVFEGDIEEKEQTFDRALVAVGVRPDTSDMGLENTSVKLDDNGFVIVDEKRRTGDEKIYAAGDVTGGALLAHKGFHEGKVAAEAIAGLPAAFDVRAVPFVVYTDPEIAWAGLTEAAAKEQNREIKVVKYPWSASGRAVGMGAAAGLTKLLVEPGSGRILGVGLAGRSAGELIAEGVLAMEMGAVAEDLALTIHPHPTFSETLAEAAQLFHGNPTHILPGKQG